VLDPFLAWSDCFELVNLSSQPVSDCGFAFFEVSQAIVRVERESLLVERNVPAGDLLVATIWRNKVHQDTFAARQQRFAPLMVYTRAGVFEYELRPPWGAGTTAVSSVFQESKFRFQHGQNVAIVVSHLRFSGLSGIGSSDRGGAVIFGPGDNPLSAKRQAGTKGSDKSRNQVNGA